MNKLIPLVLAFFLALALSILPLPAMLSAFRPPWILIAVLYCQFCLNRFFPLLVLLLLGLCLDVLLVTAIGEHVFALTLTAWLASKQASRFQIFSFGKQLIAIGSCCFLYQAVLCMIDSLQGFQVNLWMPMTTTATALLFWPWTRLIMDDSIYPYRL